MLFFFTTGITSTITWTVLPRLPFLTPTHLNALKTFGSLIYSILRNVVSQRAPSPGSLAPSSGGPALGELFVTDHSASMHLSTPTLRVKISSRSPMTSQCNFTYPYFSLKFPRVPIPLASIFLIPFSFCRSGMEVQAPSPTAEEEKELLADPVTLPSSQR